ncbi:SRPBCC family protein [Cognatilysobacter bugurensis]|uniref:Polyketide cyclase n=1 Tax=Cognatilysobacter bugurensis TaxID=543356 RepID=A0A918W4Y2_9GAMM|nr:SRPBCC family protein [Lysobacter bugurensis]GHA69247.1 polyketide cyclase [Lysobacter bugurensis]
MTRLLEILISVAIVAVLFLAVGLVLPSSRHISHSVETNRKLTIVYDTLNSLGRFDEWNPLVLRDPAMQIKLSGPESGKGARLDYVSKEDGLGEGSWEIVETEPRKSVTYAIENPERGENKRTKFILEPTGRNGRNVEITQTYDVDYGWNLLGRYAGLYVSSSVGEDIKMGLRRLSNMLAGVPNYDYADLAKDDPSRAPKLEQREAANLLVVSAAVDRDNEKVKAQMQSNMEWIKKVMAANNLEPAGPVRIITNEFGAETYSFDVAQPVRKAGSGSAAAASEGEEGAAAAAPVAAGPVTQLEGLKLDGPVEQVFSPASRVATVPFTGHMASLPKVRDAVRGWAMTRGYEAGERPYEAWINGIAPGFTEEGEFKVYWAIK